MSAIEEAHSIFEELRDDIGEVVDNAEGGLAETSRIQTLSSTKDELDNIADDDVPELPDVVGEIQVTYTTNIRKGQTRTIRCNNGLSALEAAINGIQGWLDDEKTEFDSDDEENDYKSHRFEAETVIEKLQEWQGYAESAEFPGMYG